MRPLLYAITTLSLLLAACGAGQTGAPPATPTAPGASSGKVPLDPSPEATAPEPTGATSGATATAPVPETAEAPPRGAGGATSTPAITPEPSPAATGAPPAETRAPVETATPAPTATADAPAATATRRPAASNPPAPGGLRSWFTDATILSAYGRAFGVAPILGRVGLSEDADELADDLERWEARLRPHVGGKAIRPAIHLIYGMATPCADFDDCLSYADDRGIDIIEDYIEPARERGWLVILDTQLGTSNPVAQVRRMIEKGYLRYDNVQVALDPEFRVTERGQRTPGIPIGEVRASEVNAASKLLNGYVRRQGLKSKKVLLVHSFSNFMIREKTSLRAYAGVDLVISADGFGSSALKVEIYNNILSRERYPTLRHRAIKLFPSGESTLYTHDDEPLLTFPQTLGLAPVPGGGRIEIAPSMIIMT